MRKTPWGFMKWFVGNLKMALTEPYSDRYAKRNIAAWGILLGVVLVNATIGLLVGPMSPFMFGFTMVGLAIYAVCLKWSIDGLSYRARMRAREEFDEIVRNA